MPGSGKNAKKKDAETETVETISEGTQTEEGIGDITANCVDACIGTSIQAVNAAMEDVEEMTEVAAETAADAATATRKTLVDAATSTAQAVRETATTAKEVAGDAATGAAETAGEAVGVVANAADTVKTVAADTTKAAAGTAKAVTETAARAFRSAGTAIRKAKSTAVVKAARAVKTASVGPPPSSDRPTFLRTYTAIPQMSAHRPDHQLPPLTAYAAPNQSGLGPKKNQVGSKKQSSKQASSGTKRKSLLKIKHVASANKK